MRISTSRCGPVKGSLSTADRKALPAQCFALPGRKYPLYVVDHGEAVPDREHAINAKARAQQAFERGKLTAPMLARVRRSADQIIALCDRLSGAPAREPARKPPAASSCGCAHALERRVLEALPGLHAEPMLQRELEKKLGTSGPALEVVLGKLHRQGRISREYLEQHGKALNAWRTGSQPAGTRGAYTVKVYCDDGRTHRHGAPNRAAAEQLALEERRTQPGPCSVRIVDASGVIVAMWDEDGAA